MAAPVGETPCVELCYISCCCNPCPNSAHWTIDGKICFGSAKSIALCDIKGSHSGKVTCTLNLHNARVNCVCWISAVSQDNEVHEPEFVSGGADQIAIVWRQRSEFEFLPIAVLKSHTGSVNAISAIYLPRETSCHTVIATAAADSTVSVWERSTCEGDFTCKQTISFGSGFALAVSLTVLPNTDVPLLACGCDDSKIGLYAENVGQFEKVQVLHGHEDWVRGVEFAHDDNGDVFLASCSQDTYIRLWRISCCNEMPLETKSEELLAFTEEIKVKKKLFTISNRGTSLEYAVYLDAVLLGHEGWVYGVHWQPVQYLDGARHQPYCLISASMDKTVIIWEFDTESGIWIDKVRLGEVGGNTLGFFGCQMSPDGSAVLAHGFHGSLHMWNYNKKTNNWELGQMVSGHFDEASDIDWDPEGGAYLLSVGLDQTTRLHAPWVRHGHPVTWHEIARPQVHGYDILCLAAVDRYKFVTGADEKVVRVFQAARNFSDSLLFLSALEITDSANVLKQAAEGASVPALGLSNKAIFSEGKSRSGVDQSVESLDTGQLVFKPVYFTKPPAEETLLQNTLWPEAQKLYGHGYEIFTVACNHQGSLVASACKASKAEHAAILLWDASSWQQVGRLTSHQLTVTQLAFSPCDRYLLSVSRDRTWSLFERLSLGADSQFKRIAYSDKKTGVHTRIIWTGAWTHDSMYFATGSRDRKVCMWKLSGRDNSTCLGPVSLSSVAPSFDDAVTAVDVAPVLTVAEHRYLLAIGLDDGSILLYGWKESAEPAWKQLVKLNSTTAHSSTVKRLRFRRYLGMAGVNTKRADGDMNGEGDSRSCLQLASCSSDWSVRVFNINLSLL